MLVYECGTCGSPTLIIRATPDFSGWIITCFEGHELVPTPTEYFAGDIEVRIKTP